MTDKNGKEMKKGDTVRITGGYFKCDNGTFKIEHAPGDADWLGSDYSLRLLNKDGTVSTRKYNLAFWPLTVTTNSYEKRVQAKEHNRANAQIEVIEAPKARKPKKAKKAAPKGTITFVYNGLKVDGKLYNGHYHMTTCEKDYKPIGTITLYARGDRFPRLSGLEIYNDSDSMTDYFENDHAIFNLGNQYYENALAAYNAQEAKEKRRLEKLAEKLQQEVALGIAPHYNTLRLKNVKEALARMAG